MLDWERHFGPGTWHPQCAVCTAISAHRRITNISDPARGPVHAPLQLTAAGARSRWQVRPGGWARWPTSVLRAMLRARVFSTGHGRKTDATDAHSIAVVAVHTTGLAQGALDDDLVALRLLADRRDELVDVCEAESRRLWSMRPLR